MSSAVQEFNSLEGEGRKVFRNVVSYFLYQPSLCYIPAQINPRHNLDGKVSPLQNPQEGTRYRNYVDVVIKDSGIDPNIKAKNFLFILK